jgi:hypothetical protein
MNKYTIYFVGTCTTEANSSQEAETIFKNHIDPTTGYLQDREIEIIEVEKAEE